jgi:hypothetical protein
MYILFIYLFAVTTIWVKAKYIHSYPNIQIQHILNPQFELLPTVCNFIKQSLELRK